MIVIRPLLAVLFVLSLTWGCGGASDGGGIAPPEIGSEAPVYSARNLAGESFDLHEARGQVVLLNVWATWCAPCVREMPKLQELHTAYEGDGLSVIGVSIDRGSAEGEVRRFVEEQGISFGILLDPDGGVESTFRTLGVPESFLIDRRGVLRHRWIGEFDPSHPEVLALVESILEEVEA